MVAEHGSSSMAMNNFIDAINDLESSINPQDLIPMKIVDLMKMINTGFVTFHRQVTDISDYVKTGDLHQKISNLDSLTQQINTNLHSLAGQVQQQQASPQQHHYKKGIL